MSHFEIIYTDARQFSPVSYWVHCDAENSGLAYQQNTVFRPPFPNKDPVKGYPSLVVKVHGFEFRFASKLEIEHCIDVLKQKNLKTTHQLSAMRASDIGPNTHWLSRLPSRLKSWKKREKLVSAFIKTMDALHAQKIDF